MSKQVYGAVYVYFHSFVVIVVEHKTRINVTKLDKCERGHSVLYVNVLGANPISCSISLNLRLAQSSTCQGSNAIQIKKNIDNTKWMEKNSIYMSNKEFQFMMLSCVS